MAIARYGKKYRLKLEASRAESIMFLNNFIACAEIAFAQGGEVSFEWPKNCLGWLRPELIKFITKHELLSILVDGCATGMCAKNG